MVKYIIAGGWNYANGINTRQISATIEDIYGFEVSEGFVSDVTDKIIPEVQDWQDRLLDTVYSVIFEDTIHYYVRDNCIIRKLAAYVILEINSNGIKGVFGIYVGDNESAKYWLGIFNELEKCGGQDIFILCDDGLTGMKEAVNAAFPKTEYQRCI